jgi:hypothetical protein
MAIVEPDGALGGDIHSLPARSGLGSVVDVVVVVGSAGIVLLVVAPGAVVVVLLVVGNMNMVVVGPADVMVVVVAPGLVVVELVGPPPPEVVVVVDAPGVVVVLVVPPPGIVVPLGEVVVVVVAPPALHVHALQRSPHGPSPASHSSPPASSQMPSPQRLSVARNGFTMPADFAVNVPVNERHCSIIVPVRIALPSTPGHDFQRARTFVPFAVPRSVALTGLQPLSSAIVLPSTRMTSGGVASSAPVSVVPGTR